MKFAVLLLSTVVTWLLNTWYLLVLIGILHSWWSLVPTMGLHTSAIVSGLVVVAVIAGSFIRSFTVEIIKDMK